MSVSPPAQARGLMESVALTTSTGAGTAFGVPPATLVAAQVTVGSTSTTPGTLQMQGSLDGTNWFNVGAAEALSTGTAVFVSTGTYLVSSVRATLTANTSTSPGIQVQVAVK